MRCQVVFALPERQWAWDLELSAGADVAHALALAQALASTQEPAPVIDWQGAPLGIFGRPCSRADPLHDGDRVEIYRPLAADPKESRRERARRLRRA